jgi:PRC-barrel domain
MSAGRSRDILGRRVVDERGRHVGRVVGVVHHGDGHTSALLRSGPWPRWRTRLVVLDSGVIADTEVHPRPPERALRVLTITR